MLLGTLPEIRDSATQSADAMFPGMFIAISGRLKMAISDRQTLTYQEASFFILSANSFAFSRELPACLMICRACSGVSLCFRLK